MVRFCAVLMCPSMVETRVLCVCADRPHTSVLGRLPQTDIYEDVKAYPVVCMILSLAAIRQSGVSMTFVTNV